MLHSNAYKKSEQLYCNAKDMLVNSWKQARTLCAQGMKHSSNHDPVLKEDANDVEKMFTS